MYRFKRISKTKMYQLVREFAGIREFPPMRQCQFGYCSRTDTCYLCFKEDPAPFKAAFYHCGSRACLLVSRNPGPDPFSPERKAEFPFSLHWLHEHGFIDKDSVKPAGKLSNMWHDLIQNPKDLPPDSSFFLVRFEDGSLGLQEFFTYTKHFLTYRKPVAWTDFFREPCFSCSVCREAYWHSRFGVMCYTCDPAYCTAVEPKDPVKPAGEVV